MIAADRCVLRQSTQGESRKKHECPFADVMLDPLGITLGRVRVKAQADQKAQHDVVPPPTFLCQRAARICQKDRTILCAGDQSFACQTVQGLAYGRYLHAKP